MPPGLRLGDRRGAAGAQAAARGVGITKVPTAAEAAKSPARFRRHRAAAPRVGREGERGRSRDKRAWALGQHAATRASPLCGARRRLGRAKGRVRALCGERLRRDAAAALSALLPETANEPLALCALGCSACGRGKPVKPAALWSRELPG